MLDCKRSVVKMRPVFYPHVRLLKRWPVFLMTLSGAALAAPFDSATVTRVENDVALGHHKKERPAAVADVVKAEDYLHTQTEARAELQFADHSIVRVGQNTVFSFDANSRTLSLQKGAMLFYIPPGSGGGHIQTPSLTAAVTGTVAKVSENLIAVLSGELTTQWGVVHAGEAIESNHGKVRIYKFDESQALAGKLVAWGGPLPEIPEAGAGQHPAIGLPDTHWLDVNEWTQTNPTIRKILSENPTVTPPATPPTPPPIKTTPPPPPVRGGGSPPR